MAKEPPKTLFEIRLRVTYRAKSWNDKSGKDRPEVVCHHARALNVLRIATDEDMAAHQFAADEDGRRPFICRDPSASGICVLVVYPMVILSASRVYS